VGCGTGTWLRAALELGVSDVVGIDGVNLPEDRLLLPAEKFLCRNLTVPVDLKRRFDVGMCLEVAEHLEPEYGKILIEILTKHADTILFSAACPGQPGQHHVNCQWPVYWQELFNHCGFVCSDKLRWQIWDDPTIEPWYRQNLFSAMNNPAMAGKEPRIRAVVHPEINKKMVQQSSAIDFPDHVRKVEQGWMPLGWYATVPFRALTSKLVRRIP